MGIFSWLTSAKVIPETVKAVGELYTTDKARIEAEAKLQEAMQPAQLQQLRNNALMELSGRVFESAWPALIGWTAGGCIFLYYVPQLLLANYLWFSMCLHAQKILAFPIKSDDIVNLVYLLFGFGGYTLVKKKLM